jgi:hypothetical protein
MLDWDSAGPGTRLWDCCSRGASVGSTVPVLDRVSHNRVLPLPQRAARLATFWTPSKPARAVRDGLDFAAANRSLAKGRAP